MPCKLALWLALSSLILMAATTIACGGSSNTTLMQGCTGGPYNVVGDWTLTVSTNGSSISGPGVIDSSGLAVFFQTTTTAPAPGDTATLPTITGACSFSGEINAYATPASGGVSTTYTAQGNVSSASSISGSASNGGTFSLTPNPALSGSVTTLTGGNWFGEFEGGTVPIVWSVFLLATGNNSSMSFTASGTLPSGATCSMSGTFNQEGGNVANLNVFAISMTSLDGGCPIGGTVTGVGFESNSDYFGINGNAPGTYFYAVPSNGAYVLEIYP